jgi:predicted ATPase/DNA-binding NarL/FixJ family response regulator
MFSKTNRRMASKVEPDCMTSALQQLEQPTHFVGRKIELQEIIKLLQDEQCRLLTLVGVGGVGKTRLALRSIRELPGEPESHFVDLQAVRSSEGLVSAIANALGITLSGQEPLDHQLLRFLEQKHLLLLLDNFEQLLESSGFLSRILEQSPNIKLLVTSREALNLQEEYLYTVKGLMTPASHHIDELKACDSVQLFVERAQRIRQDFSLAEEWAGIVRICQLVEGMPLAIEMAASWVKILRCATIAAEIQQNLSFLQSNLRNVQQRHQSMQAVFAQTWSRLSAAEQTLFKQLSVFRGGFDREAAEAIAGASLYLLSSLLDKCLLRRDQRGRYRIHELLRQYADEKLTSDEAAVVALAHCHYFADFLDARNRRIVEKEQLDASREIERDLENVRAAWQYAIDHQYVEALEKMAGPYFYYCQIRSRFLESASASEAAVSVLDTLDQQPLVAQIIVYWSWMLIRIGRFDRAEQVLKRSLSLFKLHNLLPTYGMGSHPLATYSVLKGIQGDYVQAIEMGEQLKSESQARADLHNLSFACYGLTSAYLSIGEYETAQQNAQQAVKYAEKVGSRWFKAYCLIEWGKVAHAVDNYDEAQSHYRASLRIREDFDDPEGIAILSAHLGEIALVQQDFMRAFQLYERSLSIYQDLNDKGGLATAYHGLGQVALQSQEIEKTASYLREALRIAAEIQFIPLILSILLDVADLMLHSDHHQRLDSILRLVAEHPASNAQHKQKVEILRRSFSSSAASSPIVLETMLNILQSELEDVALARNVEQPLLDPLTPRELEILQMIAAGLSNPEIAEKLVIAPGTVKAHTSSIYSKLGVSNRTKAASKARELGILL